MQTTRPLGLSNPFCRPAADPLPEDARPWQRRPVADLAGAVLAVLPLMVLSIWMSALGEDAATLRMMLAGPLVGGSILIFWTLGIHRLVCGDRPGSLGLRTDRWWVEAASGVGLAVVLLVLQAMLAPLLSRLFPPQPPPPQILQLVGSISRSPWLLAVWLGPVVWLGVAGFEELWRAHLLRRLWRLLPGRAGRGAAIILAAALVCCGHLYQPPAIMLSIGLLSVAQGWYFLKTGRLWSLVVAHALFDSVQVIFAVLALRAAGLA